MSGKESETISLPRNIHTMPKLDLLESEEYQNFKRNKNVPNKEMEGLLNVLKQSKLDEEVIFWSFRLFEKDHDKLLNQMLDGSKKFKLNQMMDIFNEYCQLCSPVDYVVAEMILSNGRKALSIDFSKAEWVQIKYGSHFKGRIYWAMAKALEVLGRHSEIMKLHR